MSDEGTRREKLTVKAINPVDGKSYEVALSHSRIKETAKRGMGAILEASRLVEYVIQNPTAIFEGIRRDADDPNYGASWRCYCGLPTCAFNASGKEVNPPAGMVFLVFVNDEMVVYNWRWDKADADTPRYPHNYKDRFRERVL